MWSIVKQGILGWLISKERQKHQTYRDLSYKQVGLFFLDSEISGCGEVKLRVVIVDISDDNVHSGRGCLEEQRP